MFIQTELLKPYPLNKELFENLPKNNYEALKEDIRKNGIKTELHITKSNIILCGHQRWNIAKDLDLKEVPVKIVKIDESDEQAVKEYVIIDNLLRSHLTTEQKYLLIAELSKVYENPTGADHKSKKYQEDNLSSGFEDVLTKTAKTWRISRKSRWRKTNEKDGFRLFRNRNFS